MRSALDVVMAWQLVNADTATTEGAIAQVKAQQGEPLPALLIAHFLKLTIRPLFQQSAKTARVTEAGRKKVEGSLPERFAEGETAEEEAARTRVWKEDAFALGILGWVVRSLTSDLAERHWPLLVPPLLALLDDGDTNYKALGCKLLTSLLSVTPAALLSRTGLGSVFSDAVTPCFSYLPTLTPEAESIPLMDAAYPALFILAEIRFSKDSSSPHAPSPYIRHFSGILHNHLLSSLTSTLELYPTLSATLLTHLQALLNLLGIHTIAHLVHVDPILVSILTNPFVAASPPLALQAIQTLQVVIATSWLRIWRWRIDVLSGVCSAWTAIGEEVRKLDELIKAGKAGEEDEKRRRALVETMSASKVVVDMLVAAVDAVHDGAGRKGAGESPGMSSEMENVDVREDMRKLVAIEPALRELLGTHVDDVAGGNL
jgi:tRNA nucleotidyltransferase (CCA-adding enzyme)